MILGSRKRYHGLAVGKGDEGRLLPRHERLDQHGGACIAIHPLVHDPVQGPGGFLPGLADNDALARGKPIRLDHQRELRIFQVRQRVLVAGKTPARGGGDVVFHHEFLGKGLAALDPGRGLLRAEYPEPGLHEHICNTRNQGSLGPHHGQIDLVFQRKILERPDIFRINGNALGNPGNACIAGSAKDRFHLRAPGNLPCKRMLPAAAANNQNFHRNRDSLYKNS